MTSDFQSTEQHDDFVELFAYGSCMCAESMSDTLGQEARRFILGSAVLTGYGLRFLYYSHVRQGGMCTIVKSEHEVVEGLLYRLPRALIPKLDVREGVQSNKYLPELVSVTCRGSRHDKVQTYVAVHCVAAEVPPSIEYATVVIRGALVANLSPMYVAELLERICRLTAPVWRQQQLPLIKGIG